MRLPPFHVAWKQPFPFWGFFALPLASMVAGCILAPSFALYHVISGGCAFFVLLSLLESLSKGCIESNWGRLLKATQPVRFWLQIAIWIAMIICATAFPITIALQQPRS